MVGCNEVDVLVVMSGRFRERQRCVRRARPHRDGAAIAKKIIDAVTGQDSARDGTGIAVQSQSLTLPCLLRRIAENSPICRWTSTEEVPSAPIPPTVRGREPLHGLDKLTRNLAVDERRLRPSEVFVEEGSRIASHDA